MSDSRETILANVRGALGRAPGAPIANRPPVLAPRVAGPPDVEIDRLLSEVSALTGVTRRVSSGEIDAALRGLVESQSVRKATLWNTSRLGQLGVARRLSALGVEVVPPDAGAAALADVDLSITEADFALPETGTLGLFSSPSQPRQVSLVPRIHLAIVHPSALRADLHEVFAEAKTHPYMVFVTGPSRTADIELTVTIGVHGPKVLHVWVVD
ncbi:MAG: LUD domain-containing protein [Acidobacteriia bacterium]|nr:LUD domain-containing protein [Terriglobia bacterium]